MDKKQCKARNTVVPPHTNKPISKSKFAHQNMDNHRAPINMFNTLNPIERWQPERGYTHRNEALPFGSWRDTPVVATFQHRTLPEEHQAILRTVLQQSITNAPQWKPQDTGLEVTVDLWVFDGNPRGFQQWWWRFELLVHHNNVLLDELKLAFLDHFMGTRARNICNTQTYDSGRLNYPETIERMLHAFANKQTYGRVCRNITSNEGTPKEMVDHKKVLLKPLIEQLKYNRIPQSEDDIQTIRDIVHNTRKAIKSIVQAGITLCPQINHRIMDILKAQTPAILKKRILKHLSYGRNLAQIPITEYLAILDSYCYMQGDKTDKYTYKPYIPASKAYEITEGHKDDIRPRSTSPREHNNTTTTSESKSLISNACVEEHPKEYIILNGIISGLVSNANEPRHVSHGNIYIGDGTDISYITKSFAQLLKLGLTGTMRSEIKTFGANLLAKEFAQSQIRLRAAPNTLHESHYDALIDVVVVDDIIQPIRISEWKKAARYFPLLTFNQLKADMIRIDILIGADQLNRIRFPETVQVNELECRQTILGPYITGRLEKTNTTEA